MKHPNAAKPPSDPSNERAAWISQAVDRYQVPLLQYAARLLRGDVDRARDVVQDAFLKMWTAERAEIESHLGQWLFRVCRNRAIDVSKKEARMKTLPESQPAPADHAGHASSEAGASGASVFAMLDSLPAKQQEVIRLKFQGGLSYREIACVMDITVNHVGVLIHTGLKTIRERLQPGAAPLTQVAAIERGR